MKSLKACVLVACWVAVSVGCEMHPPQKPKDGSGGKPGKGADAVPAATPQSGEPAPQFFPTNSNG